MPTILKRPNWWLPESAATPESTYRRRREFLKQAGLASIGVVAGACAPNGARSADPQEGKVTASEVLPARGRAAVDAALAAHPDRYPAPRNPGFELDRALTDREIAANYNNFYEFRNDKVTLPRYAQELTVRPWAVKVSGLVERKLTLDVDDLIRQFGLEERLYRHRCVERWAMAVPWTGFPLHKLIDHVKPLSSAKFVAMKTFLRPAEAIGQRIDTYYKWPYYEALRMDEARNDLTMLVTGIYGEPMPTQHGAPLRLVVPWKYGYKSIKSIVEIEFVERQPGTFWNDLQPREYDFLSNVDPNVPHPRWSQAVEQMLGTGEERPTQMYNGYADLVAELYA